MKKLYLLVCLMAYMPIVFAQTDANAPKEFEKAQQVKMNLSSLALGNIYLQYENVFSPHSSFALGVSYMPSRGIPNAPDEVKDLSFSGYSVTPEYRYHFSGKGIKGFYMAPYFRYAKYSTNAFEYRFEKDNGLKDTLYMQSAEYTGTTFGLMFGAQWKIGKSLTLDFWIVGVGVGSTSYEVSALGTFDQIDKDDFNKNINDTDLPFGKVSGTMTNTTATIEYSSPIGVRGLGICLGYVF